MAKPKEVREVCFSDGSKILSSSLSERLELKNAQYVVFSAYLLQHMQKHYKIQDMSRKEAQEVLESLYCEKHNIKRVVEQQEAKTDKISQAEWLEFQAFKKFKQSMSK
jgi:hypothetical protein